MGKMYLDKHEKISKVPTLEELNEELKKYGVILDSNIIKYLKSLVDLEISALRKDILTKEEREMLGEITLYRKVTTYNIYHRAIELIEKQKENYNISVVSNENEYEGIIVSGITPQEDTFSLFDYHYSISEPYISLYEYIEDRDQREKEMVSILDELEYLYDEHNPYYKRGLFKGTRSKWGIEHQKRISELEREYYRLDTRGTMPQEEKYKSEIKNYFAELFEKEYDICPKKDYIDTSKSTYNFNRRSHIIKELKCEYPTLTLKKEIKYY